MSATCGISWASEPLTAPGFWLPRSACGATCLPHATAVPKVSLAHAVVRVVAGVAVLLAGLLTFPLLPLLRARSRAGAGRLIARALLAALGVRYHGSGRLPRQGALLVVNHVSWLDPLVTAAYSSARLVAKSDVRDYPVIGWLAARAGTLFIDRNRPRTLPGTVAEVADVLREGGVVVVFPEGTTWCGRAGGPFRPALLQSAIDADVPVVPVTVRFRYADGTGTTVAAFVGDDTLVASLRRVITTRGLRVEVRAHPALHPAPGASRRSLANAALASAGNHHPGAHTPAA